MVGRGRRPSRPNGSWPQKSATFALSGACGRTIFDHASGPAVAAEPQPSPQPIRETDPAPPTQAPPAPLAARHRHQHSPPANKRRRTLGGLGARTGERQHALRQAHLPHELVVATRDRQQLPEESGEHLARRLSRRQVVRDALGQPLGAPVQTGRPVVSNLELGRRVQRLEPPYEVPGEFELLLRRARLPSRGTRRPPSRSRRSTRVRRDGQRSERKVRELRPRGAHHWPD
jgi:hypothetical protein